MRTYSWVSSSWGAQALLLSPVMSSALFQSQLLQYLSTYLIKHILQLELRQSRALHIFDRTQVLRHPLPVLLPHRLHLLLAELIPYLGIIPQIRLSADDQTRHAGAVVVDFGKPFLSYVLEGGRGSDGEADKKDVGLRVRERA